MTAFDTTTNTGSTTFTNSYGTIDLLPSASLQHVHGFQRTSGWRYFEVKIENVGGDRSKVFCGYALTPITTPVREYVWGNNSSQAHIDAHSMLTLDPGAIGTASLTAETGDIFMFAADLTGAGRDHAGNAQVAGTVSSGTGVILHPAFIEVGKNGVWFTPPVGVIGFEWASGGYPMKAWPVVTRDSTSATAAQISLKVLSQSFAYTIPTGMVEWGDGPEGGGSLTADASVNWDNTKKSDGMSLSGSNLYAVIVSNGTFPKRDWVYSTILPTTGKRYIEFTAQQTDSLTFSNWGSTEWLLGLADANIASITSSPTEAAGMIVTMVGTTSIFKRTVNSSASITNATGWNTNQTTPSFGMMIDFDNSRMWFVNPYAPGGTSNTPWWGDKQAGTQAYGYSFGATTSTDGITFTASVGARISANIGKDYFHNPVQMFLKMNPEGPFETYPLLPGATSMNGSRRVIAHGGDYWDVANNPASMTYGAADLVVIARTPLSVAHARNVKNSGKKYFEIYKESDGHSGVTMDFCFGLRLQGATTMTNINMTPLLDTGLFFCNGGTLGRQSRYGVTTTWSATESVTTAGAGENAWQGCAVDFDTGKIWGGTWNKVQHRMEWGAGSDPATGVGAHMTFTASTTMRIAVTWQSTIAINSRVVLVTDPANVIGKPPGFDPWDPDPTVSLTSTPSAGGSGGILNIWPFGIVT